MQPTQDAKRAQCEAYVLSHRGRRSLRVWMLRGLVFSIGSMVACGGSVVEGPRESAPDPMADATVDAPETSLRDVSADRPLDAVFDARETSSPEDTGVDARPDVPFVEEGCEDAGGIVANFRCGLFDQSGCSQGEGCYPYSLSNGRCGAMEHGSFCRAAGTKGQGETCASRLECAAGFTCVITGSGQGTICVKLCNIYSTVAQCPEGQTCFGLSVQTVGTCH